MVDDNAAIVTYRVDITVLVDGNEQHAPSYATSVWTNTSGQWRVVVHQQTAL